MDDSSARTGTALPQAGPFYPKGSSPAPKNPLRSQVASDFRRAHRRPGGPTQTGSGNTTESGQDSSNSNFTSQYALGGGSWQIVGGTVTASASGSSQATDASSGGHTRPLLGGTLQGTWQESGNADSAYSSNVTSTPDGFGNWITTGGGTSSDDASGSSSNSGSGTFSQSSASSYAGGGPDSYMSGNADESASSSWTYLDASQSTLASDGTTTSVTTLTASGNSSGGDDYTATGGSNSWSKSGNSSNGTSSSSHDAWGQTISESQGGQWQDAYTVTAGPGGATTTVGSGSGSSQASGDATAYDKRLEPERVVGDELPVGGRGSGLFCLGGVVRRAGRGVRGAVRRSASRPRDNRHDDAGPAGSAGDLPKLRDGVVAGERVRLLSAAAPNDGAGVVRSAGGAAG